MLSRAFSVEILREEFLSSPLGMLVKVLSKCYFAKYFAKSNKTNRLELVESHSCRLKLETVTWKRLLRSSSGVLQMFQQCPVTKFETSRMALNFSWYKLVSRNPPGYSLRNSKNFGLVEEDDLNEKDPMMRIFCLVRAYTLDMATILDP